MSDADVVVVGGGPVGLASAIEARLAGLSVMVIEPREDVIDKACGEGLMPGALPLLKRLGIDPEGMPLRGVSYRSAGARADHLFRAGIGRGVRRTTLQTALADRAAQLGVARTVGRVERLRQDADGVTVYAIASGGSVVDGIRSRWLFGVDGLHSTVRGLAGLEHPAPRSRRRYGLRRHFFAAPWSELIEVYWTRTTEVYITPVAPDTVGVAVLGQQRIDLAEAIAEIPELQARLGHSEPASSLRGAGPFRQQATRPSAGRVLLVGDASGYVDAITGEGLRLGFDQARIAAAHVAIGDVSGYNRAWAKSTRDFRMLTSQLVGAANSPLRSAIVPAASRMPSVFGAVVERLAR